MNIKIQSVRFDADQKLLDFIDEKVNKLNQFDDKIIGAEVFLRLDKSENLENKVAEIRINVSGTDLFAKKQCKSFEEATDLTVEALRRQLVRHKAKKTDR
ncbi:MAG: ribosome-associated translation inhibitor RaiA [Bacteroidales bacterium]|jgi:putative sigma-54 modulation protein|nr:ribosome-associated translation inhibitor RaiA [Bacteroidales bacterium]MDD2570225.1 ribosome-associated translation inhibitor RaiA [Bacteroidales bacterium]MDD2812615.1 ribosome-associated translation inhibitor RaiA [Bacteroidales bacterium]MDD3384382.1 ribosome-associated translation inhibitor RaiA [Bacteroidales bacterium]MDD3811701.1 ribosome-associated translation inhibitor RaiA [Bacteroidales bacterium]